MSRKTSESCTFIDEEKETKYNVIRYILIYHGGMYKWQLVIKKLWKLLIDLDMKKKDLQQAAGVSSALIAKLGRNENVSTDSLVKICSALHCDIGDIMEVVDL